jgi:mersacidin/lichenicidin family type 2 lantibiotic
MTIANIIRAWEDPEYRKSLSADELPENPVGQIELTEDELSEVMGASRSGHSITCNTFSGCCASSRGNSVQPCPC